MESEDEVDVEGDFDLCARNNLENVLNDFNEPPSKMALLQPEISQHPWALEQGWSLDQCTDERSRAAIEKMLLEEQSYMEGNEVLKETAESSFKVVNEAKSLGGKSSRRLWTEEEKALFQKGIEIFGKKWSKIAELIPTRTSEQVKHYGYNHFRKIQSVGNGADTTSSKGHFAHSLKEMLTAVTTGQPTVPALPKTKLKEKSSTIKSSGKTAEETVSVADTPNTVTPRFPQSEVVRLQRQSDDEAEEVNIEDEEDSFCEDSLNPQDIPIETQCTRSVLNMSDSNSLFHETDIGIVDSSQVEHVSGTSISDKRVSPGIPNPCKNEGINLSKEDIHDPQTFSEKFTDKDLEIASEIVTTFEFTENNSINSLHKPVLSSSLLKSHGSNDIQAIVQESLQSKQGSRVFGNALKTEKILGIHLNEGDKNTVEGVKKAILTSDLNSCVKHAQSESENGKGYSIGRCENQLIGDDAVVLKGTLVRSFQRTEQNGCPGQLEGKSHHTEESLSEEEEYSQEFPIDGSDGKIFYLPNPVTEKAIERDCVSGEEKEVFVEFFDGRPGLKDAERYCRIRNYILDMWEDSKPSFLYKTNIRVGLKKCGDVNVVGRIHAYLEQVGAINFGCDQVQYKQKKKAKRRKSSANSSGEQLAKYRKEALQQRRRKVRDMFGSWVDEKEKEGTTIDHENPPKTATKPEKSPKKRVKHHYDPFKLIPCQDFTSSVLAPFEVEIDLTSLILMDLHAHLSKTEVIGLLGGQFNSKRKVLEILLTEPCDSLSTGMQCEMDPVSQTEAKERIASQDMKVVGWYHSHPTFEPNPSIRDIETQECLQEWFAVGKNPFIGVIVNPYSSQNSGMRSTIRSIIISRHTNKCANMGLPFQFHHHVVSKRSDSEILDTCNRLLVKYSKYQNKVDMLTSFRPGSTLTCIDKLVVSINNHFEEIGLTKANRIRKSELDHFLWTLKNMVENSFNAHFL